MSTHDLVAAAPGRRRTTGVGSTLDVGVRRAGARRSRRRPAGRAGSSASVAVVDRPARPSSRPPRAAASRSAGGSVSPGRPVSGSAALEHLRLERLREAAGRLAEVALRRTRPPTPGNASSRSGSSTSLGRQVVGDHEQGHVADDLRRRRHLDDVAEQPVDLGVRAGRPRASATPGRAPRACWQQVRVLAAGHLVLVDVGGAGAACRVSNGGVQLADRLPVVG